MWRGCLAYYDFWGLMVDGLDLHGDLKRAIAEAVQETTDFVKIFGQRKFKHHGLDLPR